MFESLSILVAAQQVIRSKMVKNLPGDAVIPVVCTATKIILPYLDYHLKSVIPNIPHVLKDTRDFLDRIKTAIASRKKHC